MAYESITIGTEQEVKEVYLFLVNEDGSPAEMDQDSKTIASIWNGEEKLVDVTADTRITIPGFGSLPPRLQETMKRIGGEKEKKR